MSPYLSKQDLKGFVLAYLGLGIITLCCMIDLKNNLAIGDTIVAIIPALSCLFISFLLFDCLWFKDKSIRLTYFLLLMPISLLLGYAIGVPLTIIIIGAVSLFIGLISWYYVLYREGTKKCRK